MRNRGAVAFAAGALLLVLAGAGPCGETKELRTASQAREYVADAIHGKSGQWDVLADDASIQAKLAWVHESEIETLSRQLQEKAEWACEAAGSASTFNDAYEHFQELPPESRKEILAYFGVSATPEEVEAIFEDVLSLGPLEVTLVISEVCP